MRKRMSRISLLFVVVPIVFAAACGWNPSVAAVPITAPWDSMNLPVKENARVWSSNATELKVVHKDDKTAVFNAYEKALQAAGWKTAGTLGGGVVEFEKGGKKLQAEIYDYENTGVILTLK